MKKLLVFIAALSVASAASAGLPFIDMGVKAGITSETPRAIIDYGAGNTDLTGDASVGFHAGVVVRLDLPLLPIYVQPELLYNWNKFEDKTNTIGDIKLSSFNVPVMVGVGFGNSNIVKLRANAGPVFNLATSVKLADTDVDILKEAFRKPTVTWSAGVGVDLISIMFDVRYNFQGGRNKGSGDGITITSSPQAWTVSLGYLF